MNKKIVVAKKIKSPKKSQKSPKTDSLKKYKQYLTGEFTNKDDKIKKTINIKRKYDKSKVDIKDINDIEQKMLEIKNTSIKMPTQNSNKPIKKPEPIKKPVKKPEAITIKRSTSKYFYNSVIYKMNEDSLDDKFLKK